MDDEILKNKSEVRTIKLHNGCTATVGIISSSVTPSLEMLKILADKISEMVEVANDFGPLEKIPFDDLALDVMDGKPKVYGSANKKLCKQLRPIPKNRGFIKQRVDTGKRGKRR